MSARTAMRVLVTGASGFVGRALCPVLAAQGHEVLRAMRRPDGLPGTVAAGDLDGPAEWLRKVPPPDVLVHLAARVHQMHERADEAELLHHRANCEGTLALARVAQDMGVKRFVFVSSIKVSGEGRPGQPYRPDEAPAPADAYGRSKAAAEAGLHALAAAGPLELVIVRPPLVYGREAAGNFRSLARALAGGWPLPLGALDGNRRSLVAVDNLADFVALCVTHERAPGRVWMVSDDEDVSTAGLVRRMGAAMGRPARLLTVPRGLLDVLAGLLGRRGLMQRLAGDLTVDVSDSKALLGWRPVVSLDQGLARALAPARQADSP
ncbi:NAD-dependent epimerase/dehydratase family protein [Methyloversatilis thermotolerans]|uniref:NAD-dependent epimerase/dehydratase family protein n=1 Tax=Methyloversatilis thermotolerans TaxID=1346290 RepID=UPI0003A2F42F|nr:NAD-dependent epimerase/dehydratase family protein [Methyloversatilis thermotolerans]